MSVKVPLSRSRDACGEKRGIEGDVHQIVVKTNGHPSVSPLFRGDLILNK